MPGLRNVCEMESSPAEAPGQRPTSTTVTYAMREKCPETSPRLSRGRHQFSDVTEGCIMAGSLILQRRWQRKRESCAQATFHSCSNEWGGPRSTNPSQTGGIRPRDLASTELREQPSVVRQETFGINGTWLNQDFIAATQANSAEMTQI